MGEKDVGGQTPICNTLIYNIIEIKIKIHIKLYVKIDKELSVVLLDCNLCSNKLRQGDHVFETSLS